MMTSAIERAAFSCGVRSLDAEIAALKAACAEMRAALEHADAMEAFVCDTPDTVEHASGETEEEPCGECIDCQSRALLSRTDFGRGVVVVPRERLTAWRDVITEIAPTCHCDEAWTSRGRHEVNALCHLADDAKAVLADLDALLKKGGG